MPAAVDSRASAFAAKLIARRHRKFAALAATLMQAANDERHAARIAAKRLRYVAEFFAPLFPGKRTRTYLETLAAAQDALGQFNDAVTAAALASELSGTADDAAAGAVRGWVAAQAAALETESRQGGAALQRRQAVLAGLGDSFHARNRGTWTPGHERDNARVPTAARDGCATATCRRSGPICCLVPQSRFAASASPTPDGDFWDFDWLTPEDAQVRRAAGGGAARARRQLGIALRARADGGARGPRLARRGAAFSRVQRRAEPDAARLPFRRSCGGAGHAGRHPRARPRGDRRPCGRRLGRRECPAQLAGARRPRRGARAHGGGGGIRRRSISPPPASRSTRASTGSTPPIS